jgi:hypothetical protein
MRLARPLDSSVAPNPGKVRGDVVANAGKSGTPY